MRELWQRIEAWLRTHAPEVLEDLHPGASEEQVRAAEQELGVELPEDVRASFLVHDGQRGAAEPLFDTWAPLSLDRVLEHWAMLGRLLDEGGFGEGEAEASGPVKPLWWNRDWWPVLHDESGNYVCIDFDPAEGGSPGQLVTFWHTSPERSVLAEGLRQFLEQFADDLEHGRYGVEDGALVRREQ